MRLLFDERRTTVFFLFCCCWKIFLFFFAIQIKFKATRVGDTRARPLISLSLSRTLALSARKSKSELRVSREEVRGANERKRKRRARRATKRCHQKRVNDSLLR